MFPGQRVQLLEEVAEGAGLEDVDPGLSSDHLNMMMMMMIMMMMIMIMIMMSKKELVLRTSTPVSAAITSA